MAEWSNAAVLKTVEGHTSGGSNPSFSAKAPEYCEIEVIREFFLISGTNTAQLKFSIRI
jgi:hypothetical protein